MSKKARFSWKLLGLGAEKDEQVLASGEVDVLRWAYAAVILAERAIRRDEAARGVRVEDSRGDLFFRIRKGAQEVAFGPCDDLPTDPRELDDTLVGGSKE